MTEDEAWNEIERKQCIMQEFNIRREAQIKAFEFIQSQDLLELGIMTLRKAYELGYLAGVYTEKSNAK
jgi:hypothetical protein